MKNCVWLRPQLVAQIEFTEWTPDDHLRHSKFVGLRKDKSGEGGYPGELKTVQATGLTPFAKSTSVDYVMDGRLVKMAKLKASKSLGDVLLYRKEGASQSTVRRHYLRWRQEQNPPLPERCDNENCRFHTEPLV